MEWARSIGTPLALLFLDFEKAYDRVDWSFLEGTLSHMGFPASASMDYKRLSTI